VSKWINSKIQNRSNFLGPGLQGRGLADLALMVDAREWAQQKSGSRAVASNPISDWPGQGTIHTKGNWQWLRKQLFLPASLRWHWRSQVRNLLRPVAAAGSVVAAGSVAVQAWEAMGARESGAVADGWTAALRQVTVAFLAISVAISMDFTPTTKAACGNFETMKPAIAITVPRIRSTLARPGTKMTWARRMGTAAEVTLSLSAIHDRTLL
jgi:hypothetical protein